MKKVLRHEIIHYGLDVCNLNCFDYNGVFHALCQIFDADTWCSMDEDEQKIFNALMFLHDKIDLIARQLNKQITIKSLLRMAGSMKREDQDILVEFAEIVSKLKIA